MKEKMIEYLNSIHWASGRDADIIEGFILDFFKDFQPERSKREDIIYPQLECKRCHQVYTQYRTCIDKTYRCPECGETNDAVL